MGFLDSIFGKNEKNQGNKQKNSNLRCSVCGTTSNKLMKEFRKKRPGVQIIDRSWVGTCPECGKILCKNCAPKVPDSIYGDPVPGCPNCKVQLRF